MKPLKYKSTAFLYKNTKRFSPIFFLAWCTPKTSRTDYFGWKMPGLTGSGSQHLWNSNWKQNLLFDGGFPTTYGRLGQSFAKCCSKKCTQTIAQSWRWSGTYLTSKYTYLPYLILVGEWVLLKNPEFWVPLIVSCRRRRRQFEAFLHFCVKFLQHNQIFEEKPCLSFPPLSYKYISLYEKFF